MKITFEIKTDNAAFGETDDEKSAEVLRIIKKRIEIADTSGQVENASGPLIDYNGNKVGFCTVKGK